MAEDQNSLDKILFKSCIDSPNDIIILAIDMHFNYLAFNEYHKEVMLKSYGKEIETGMNILDCITNDEDVINSKINFGRAMSGESHITVQEYGEIYRQFYETRYYPIYNEKREIIGATSFSSNVTERTRLQESLEKSEGKFRKAFITSPDSININRLLDGMYVTVNEGFTKLMGYTERDVIGKTSVEMNIWNNSADREKLVKELKKNGNIENLEATRQIKVIRADVPVIAITAYVMSGDEERVLAAGCDGYLSKPINKEKLLRKIAEFVKI